MTTNRDIAGPDEPTPASGMSRRQFLRRGMIAAGLTLVAPVVACGTNPDSTLARAQRHGFIRVGFANEAPFGYVTDDGTLTGVGPELARQVFQTLDVEQIDGVLSPFGSLIERLNEGRFDVIAAGMFITADRCRQVIFSDPHFCIEQAFLVPKGNPFGLYRYEDVAQDSSRRLGVVVGAVEVEQAVASGVPETQTVRVDTPADLLNAVRSGRVDAGALSTISLTNLADQAPLDDVEVTPSFAYGEQPGCGAFAFRREDMELRDEFNSALRRLRNSGTLAKSSEPFGFLEASKEADGQTAGELCER